MFDQAFDSLRKATEATVEAQQEMCKRWFSLFPTAPAFPSAWTEQVQRFQKKWAEAVQDLMKRQRETTEAQFKLGLQNIEKAFQVGEIKTAEDFRARAIELWQKSFEGLRVARARSGAEQADVAALTPLRFVRGSDSCSSCRYRRCCELLGSAVKELTDLLVADLVEVVIPAANRTERLRSAGADNLVGFRSERGAGVGRSYGDGHDDPARFALAQGGDGRPHARAGRQPVINQDDDVARHVGRRAVDAVSALAPLELGQLVLGDLVDELRRDVQAAHHLVVEHARAAGGDGPQRQLFHAGHAKLSNEENVQGGPQRAGHQESHRHATARQGQHDHVVTSGVALELLGQFPAGVESVAKEHGSLLSSTGPARASERAPGLVRSCASSVVQMTGQFRARAQR
jgi:hypothetical protein